MHELYHGLMVSGGNIEVARDSSGGAYKGRFLSDSFMWRFDTFLAVGTAKGDCAISSYREEPRQMGDALTSNNLWFRGKAGRVSRLYAPAKFEDGSSVYHLSEGAYGGEEGGNNLMTPSMPMKYASHELGPLMRQMQALMLNESEKGAAICTQNAQPMKLAHAPVNSKGKKSPSSSPTPSVRPTEALTRTPHSSPTRARKPLSSARWTHSSTPTRSRTPSPSASGAPASISAPPRAPVPSVSRTPWPYVSHYDARPSPAKFPPQHAQSPTPNATLAPARTMQSRTGTLTPSSRASQPSAADSRAPFPERPTTSVYAPQTPTSMQSSTPSPPVSPAPNATKSIFDNFAACFPNSATVELVSGVTVEMSTLRVGDRVRTGPASFSDVFMFTHKDLEISTQFVRLQLGSNSFIELSGGHYISANGVLTAAKNVRRGDLIQFASGKASSVSSIQRTVHIGLHNPQTLDGSIVVNGIISSTFTEVISARVASALLAPVRALYCIRVQSLTHTKIPLYSTS